MGRVLWVCPDCSANPKTKKTGVAILGKPIPQLATDPLVQGDIKKAAVEVGEQYALVSLASEVFILTAAGISPDKFRPYLGRGQYPKFVHSAPLSKKV